MNGVIPVNYFGNNLLSYDRVVRSSDASSQNGLQVCVVNDLYSSARSIDLQTIYGDTNPITTEEWKDVEESINDLVNGRFIVWSHKESFEDFLKKLEE